MKKSFVIIILAGLMFGTSGIFVNYLSPYGFSPMQMTAMRGLVSALAMVIYTVIVDRPAFKSRPRELFMYFACGMMLLLTATLYYTAIQLTSIATAAVLMYTAPIFVSIYSAIFLGEKMTPQKIGAIAAMLIGCIFVSGVIGSFEADFIGILAGLGSGVCYAAYIIISKTAMKDGASPTSLSAYAFIFMSLVALPISNPVEIVRLASDAWAWVMFILLGLVTFVIPYFLYNTALKSLNAGTASSLAIIEPMSATVYAMIIFGEIPDIFGAIGIVLILGSVYLLGYIESRADAHTEGDSEIPN